ncbi:hypothetical protein FA13DRAFT_1732547 [Coprinellus micaceus]|uniref:Uncharacterized protein n=1 Tax=Coprinellus micaceus TaxID=71717 RepID=A0A4Y7TBX7_COPMI|nr:hypothetical protein FA13DRAFT_1732547 [Coprinellus micaceus]
MCKDPLASRSKDPIPGLRQLHPACVRSQHSLSNICNMSLFGSKKRHSYVGDKVGDASRPPSVLSDDRGHSVVIDYSKKGSQDVTKGIFYTGLPQAFRNVRLYKDFHAMDQKLLEALGATFKQFSTGNTSERLFQDMSWDYLTEAFATSHFFKKQGNTSEKHMAASKGKVIQDAKAWFGCFVDDPEVSDSIQLSFPEIAEGIANFQKPVEGPDGRAITRDQNDQHEEVFLDIGVLRFPDFEKPFIKVYRLKLIAWTEYNVKAMRIRSGIRGEFNSCKYVPRSEFLATFQPQLLEEARRLAMGLLAAPSSF